MTTLTPAERERIAELRRMSEPPSDARGWLEGLKRFTRGGSADRRAIDAALSGREGRGFGAAGSAEFDRRFPPSRSPNGDATDATAEAQAAKFWDEFDHDTRSAS